MKKNILFLEGPIQTGKSTLIRSVLGDCLTRCGGFASQRLIDTAGNTRGFRLGPAAKTPLTAPAGEFLSDPGETASLRAFQQKAGIFKWFEADGRVITDQSVFDTVGVDLLCSSMNRPLILLDEIGGSELLCEPFRKALFETLRSGIPCLGVMKLAEGARRLEGQYQASSKGRSISEYNKKIRRLITKDLGGRILFYERAGAGSASVETELTTFVDSLFHLQP